MSQNFNLDLNSLIQIMFTDKHFTNGNFLMINYILLYSSDSGAV